jgi:hypothetical protein
MSCKKSLSIIFQKRLKVLISMQKIYEKSKSVGEGQKHFTERTLLGSREGLLGKKISSFSIDHC